MSEVVPTIQTTSLEDYWQKLKAIEGFCPRVGVDILDGKFVPGQTISLEALKEEPLSLRLDLHLMVKEPEEWVSRALELLPDRLIAQVEMMYDREGFIAQAAEAGAEVGIALDIETPIESVNEEIYHQVDQVLILGAKAGFSGQEFDQRALKKIEAIRAIVGELVDIGVDCGMNDKTIPLCQKAGANIFYINSSFWQAEDLAKRYQGLTELVNK